MIGKVVFLAAAWILAVGIAPARADDSDWAGIYVGIDAVDGSIDTLSIVPRGDGTFDIRMSSTGFALCDGGAGAGVLLATGRIANNGLARENVTYKCLGDNEAKPFPDGTYLRDEKTGILTIDVPSVGRTNYYHRVSGD